MKGQPILGRRPELPRPPDFSAGLCASHPHPDWWTSERTGERRSAISVCRACPIVAQCAAWAIHLPTTDLAVYGGMASTERIARKRQAAAATARPARTEAQRQQARQSERRRRMLGKAPTTRERYAKDPEPFKAQARALLPGQS